ncbi:PAS domain S-box protein [Legionella sp. km772]|uniref:PAS domain S-box protein n=1 Tax=Legionella sp. km772 TaxID=2498111 RepID=UPI0013156B8A|nr:PAS domain S-box protein [Legionella sp. km772]
MKKNLEFSIPANILCAFFIFLVLVHKTSPLALFVWCAAIILVSSFRVFIYLKYSTWSTSLNLKFLAMGAILSALLWGIAGSALMPDDNFLDQRLMAFIIISIATVEIDALKSNPSLSFLFLILSLLPLNVWFFYAFSTSYFLLSLAFFTYFCLILLVFLRSYSLLVNSFILRYQNLNLIEKLYLSNEGLEESQSRFHAAFDFAAIGMALVSLEGHFLKVNKSLCQLVGYSEEELLKLTFQDLTYQDDLGTDLKLVQQLLEGEILTYQLEKRYLHKKGTIIWTLLSVSLLRDKENNPLYFISQIQNIDARKKAEKELKDLAYHSCYAHKLVV